MSEQAGFSFQSGWKRWAVKGNGIGRGLGGEQTALGRVMDGGNVARPQAGGLGAAERCSAPSCTSQAVGEPSHVCLLGLGSKLQEAQPGPACCELQAPSFSGAMGDVRAWGLSPGWAGRVAGHGALHAPLSRAGFVGDG